MTPNLALRWITVPGALRLVADGLLVAYIVRRIIALFRAFSIHPVVCWLRLGTATVATIVASVWLLSAVGRLDASGFLGLHLLAAALLAWATRRHPRPLRRGPGLATALFLTGDRRGRYRRSRLQRLLLTLAGWLLVALLAYALVLALGVFAVNWDSQTYRLSRVGYWLQERRVSLDFANDPRLGYMPFNSELFMLWLTGFFPTGYPLVNLAQFLGGGLTLLSVFELGRLSGLSREGRLLAAFLMLGVPIVILEFATSQSDLFAGGLLNAGLVFFWRAIRNRSRADALFFGLAFGLSLGAKGTVFYWIPGLLAWGVFLRWRHRAGFWSTLKLIAIAGGVALLVGGWNYADNYRRYGNPFAPPEEIARNHHQGGGDGVATASFIALIHFWQLVPPGSNPKFLAPLLHRPEQFLAERIEPLAPDPGLLASYRGVRNAYDGDYVAEDTASYGLVVPCLFALGLIVEAVRSIRASGSRMSSPLAMTASLAFFFIVFFHKMYLNPFTFRYFVMLAPFVAIVAAAAWPTQRAWKLGMATAFSMILLQAYSVLDFQNRNILGGWRSLASRPDATALFESLAGQLSNGGPGLRRVALALPTNSWLSPYFRLPHQGNVQFLSLGTLLSYRSPAQFFRQTGYDGLITDPRIFAANNWSGVNAQTNGLSGGFARVLFTRAQ